MYNDKPLNNNIVTRYIPQVKHPNVCLITSTPQHLPSPDTLSLASWVVYQKINTLDIDLNSSLWTDLDRISQELEFEVSQYFDVEWDRWPVKYKYQKGKAPCYKGQNGEEISFETGHDVVHCIQSYLDEIACQGGYNVLYCNNALQVSKLLESAGDNPEEVGWFSYVDIFAALSILNDSVSIYGGVNGDHSSYFVADSIFENIGQFLIMPAQELEDIEHRGCKLGEAIIIEDSGYGISYPYTMQNIILHRFKNLDIYMLPIDEILDTPEFLSCLEELDRADTWNEFKDILYQSKLIAVPSFFLYEEDGEVGYLDEDGEHIGLHREEI